MKFKKNKFVLILTIFLLASLLLLTACDSNYDTDSEYGTNSDYASDNSDTLSDNSNLDNPNSPADSTDNNSPIFAGDNQLNPSDSNLDSNSDSNHNSRPDSTTNSETSSDSNSEPSSSSSQSSLSSSSSQSSSKSKSNLRFGVEGLAYDELANPDLWFKNAKARGISLMSFDPFDIELANTIIDSEVLGEMGFSVDSDFPNLLQDIFLASKKYDIKLTIMIEALAHAKSGFLDPSAKIRKRKITKDSVAKFISDLGLIAKNNDIQLAISEEAFDKEFLPSIASSAKLAGIKYVHFFDDLNCLADTVWSEDYGYYFKDLKNNKDDQAQARANLAIGSYYGELGFLNIMYGSAKACNKEYGTLTAGGWGMGAKTHQNIALLRSIQFSPSSFFFVLAEDANGNTLEGEPDYVANYDFKNLNNHIVEFGKKQSDQKKPVANLIIDYPSENLDVFDYFDDALLGSVSAITNSILSAGFDLEVSKKPVKNADLYYVFSSAFVYEEGKDLSIELLNLRTLNVPVFYQVIGEISEDLSPNLNSLLLNLGVNNYIPITSDSNDFEPIPLKTSAIFPNGEFEFNYAGYSLGIDNPDLLGKYSVTHSIHLINPADVSSEVLLSGFTSNDQSRDKSSSFNDETALIIKKDNVYFVNGGFLHFATIPFLTNLISNNPVFNEPNYVYLTTGNNRTAVFTAYASDLDLNIPANKDSKITEFDETGKEIVSDLVLNDNHLTGKLDKFHLLIVS